MGRAALGCVRNEGPPDPVPDVGVEAKISSHAGVMQVVHVDVAQESQPRRPAHCVRKYFESCMPSCNHEEEKAQITKEYVNVNRNDKDKNHREKAIEEGVQRMHRPVTERGGVEKPMVDGVKAPVNPPDVVAKAMHPVVKEIMSHEQKQKTKRQIPPAHLKNRNVDLGHAFQDSDSYECIEESGKQNSPQGDRNFRSDETSIWQWHLNFWFGALVPAIIVEEKAPSLS